MISPGRKAQHPPAYETVSEFAVRALPGGSERMRRFRRELLEFAFSPISRSIFLTGDRGTGQEIARLVALFRATAPLTEESAVRRLEAVKFQPGEAIDVRALAGFYAEIDITGRGEMDASEELFGRGAASSGERPARAGLFERALLLGGRRTATAELTGGVVFIGEPADLGLGAQARLAGLCAGGPFERFGASEEDEALLDFGGVLVCSSWRDNGCEGLRPDLARHLATREVRLPRLSERPEDFSAVLAAVTARVRREYRVFVDRVTLHSEAAREHWRTHSPPARLPVRAQELLARVDWSRNGEIDGLTDCVRDILVGGSDPERALAHLAPSTITAVDQPADALVRRLERLGRLDREGLAGALRGIEVQNRRELHDRLKSDRATLARLAATLEVEPDRLLAQAYQTGRRRRTRSEGEPS